LKPRIRTPDTVFRFFHQVEYACSHSAGSVDTAYSNGKDRRRHHCASARFCLQYPTDRNASPQTIIGSDAVLSVPDRFLATRERTINGFTLAISCATSAVPCATSAPVARAPTPPKRSGTLGTTSLPGAQVDENDPDRSLAASRRTLSFDAETQSAIPTNCVWQRRLSSFHETHQFVDGRFKLGVRVQNRVVSW